MSGITCLKQEQTLINTSTFFAWKVAAQKQGYVVATVPSEYC
jgi:hypothetical protein